MQNVAAIFGFAEADFLRIKAECMGNDATDPYQVLGVAHDAPDDELKAAYRKLVRENHPDTLIAQGMPESSSTWRTKSWPPSTAPTTASSASAD